MDLRVIFITGLTAGGLGCVAVQGGLLASTITAREEEDLEEGSHRKHSIQATLAFLTTKFISHIILGFVLGAFGGVLALSDNTRITMQILAGSYMIAIALNLLNIHPIFRYAIIQPPRFLTRKLRDTSRSKDLFAPAILGALTIFIPCGTTLAMEALAISSGKGVLGAAILGAFVLGTSPLFLGLGFLTTTLGDVFKKNFFKIAAILVLYLGITSVNGALLAAGSPINLQALRNAIPIEIDLSGGAVATTDANVKMIGGQQVVDISVFPSGYSPNSIQVRAGIPVKLNLNPVGGLGCTSGFVIPQFGIRQRLTQGVITPVEFTPKSPGKISWTCSMGMYYGTIEVI